MGESRFFIDSPSGKISVVVQRPSQVSGKCPVVILMHGLMASKNLEPLKSMAKALPQQGIASLSFDFNGHGRSYGKMSEMTVLNEIDDARVVYDYVCAQEWAGSIAFAGHSQGGVVSAMLAGELGPKLSALVLLSPAPSLKDEAISGSIMGRRFDPENPPERLHVYLHTLGRDYITVARSLPIYEKSSAYEGPVCIIHGANDIIVPVRYAEEFNGIYKNSELHVIPGEGHFLRKKRNDIIELTVNFLKNNLS